MPEEDSRYFDHGADIGIIGTGDTMEAAFISAAGAMFTIMAEPSQITPTETITIEFDESDQEIALVIWLNQLLAKARIHNIILSQFKLKHNNDHWTGEASGEVWSDDIIRGTEVKGATFTMLSVKQSNNEWEARCVVDV